MLEHIHKQLSAPKVQPQPSTMADMDMEQCKTTEDLAALERSAQTSEHRKELVRTIISFSCIALPCVAELIECCILASALPCNGKITPMNSSSAALYLFRNTCRTTNTTVFYILLDNVNVNQLRSIHTTFMYNIILLLRMKMCTRFSTKIITKHDMPVIFMKA